MPIYAYKCASCGHVQDVLMKVTDIKLTICPSCGKETFNKQLTAPGFQLKGSGWYATDFKNGGKQSPSQSGANKTEANKVETNKPEVSTEKKSDAAPSPAACATGCACH